MQDKISAHRDFAVYVNLGYQAKFLKPDLTFLLLHQFPLFLLQLIIKTFSNPIYHPPHLTTPVHSVAKGPDLFPFCEAIVEQGL